MTGTHRFLAALAALLLLCAWGASLAQAQSVTFKFDYAGYGSFESKSSVDDDAGCRRQADWIGQYAFRQDWKVHGIALPHRLQIHTTAEYAGTRDLAGHPTSLDVTGTQVTQPEQACEWAGGSDDTGKFQCGDDHPKLLYDKVLDISSGADKRIIFRAPAFIAYNPLLRGSNSIPSLKTTGCLAIADSAGQYSPGPDITVRIPIKAATLLHLKKGHYFRVHTGLGHYTVKPDQTGQSCLLVTKGPHDSCTVEQDSYTGEIAVKRIQ
ncbi:MAG TPA: hypothetical protein VHV28_08175 [Solirubrobacteraceae bacterium]|nr:hypothetical protein [Solirubrobacteraceae bacterium]